MILGFLFLTVLSVVAQEIKVAMMVEPRSSKEIFLSPAELAEFAELVSRQKPVPKNILPTPASREFVHFYYWEYDVPTKQLIRRTRSFQTSGSSLSYYAGSKDDLKRMGDLIGRLLAQIRGQE
jgi:hypothetical protein